MNRLLARVWNSRYGKYLLPLSFCIGNLINILLFYLGLAYTDNAVRDVVFIIGNVLFTLVAAVALLSVLRFGRMKCRTLLPLGIVLLFYMVCYLMVPLRHGFTSSWIHSAGQFACFSFPAFCAGIYAAVKQQEETLFASLERLGFCVAPAALIYLNGALFGCNPFHDGWYLGIINYMDLAYTIMPFLLALVVQFSEKRPLTILGRTLAYPQWVRGVLIALFWVVICATGTRGTYFCVLGFCVCLVGLSLLHRSNRRRTMVVSAAMALLLFFNIFVYSPKGFNTWRMKSFVDGLTNGEIVTGTDDENVDDYLEDMVKADGDRQIANRPKDDSAAGDSAGEIVTGTDVENVDDYLEGMVKADGDRQIANRPEDDPAAGDFAEDHVGSKNLTFRNRGTLFKLAIMEFQKSPIVGMGPMGYLVKYGLYPHNAILQILCETGIIGFLFFMTFIIWAIIRMLRIGRRRKEIRYLILLFVAYAIQANISGDLWNCSALLCALGYGFALSGAEQPVKK